MDRVARAIRRSPIAVQVVAVTDGGGPDSSQRQAVSEAFALHEHEAMTHAWTTSAMTRGIVTAFPWLARNRAVAPRPEAFVSVCAERH